MTNMSKISDYINPNNLDLDSQTRRIEQQRRTVIWAVGTGNTNLALLTTDGLCQAIRARDARLIKTGAIQ